MKRKRLLTMLFMVLAFTLALGLSGCPEPDDSDDDGLGYCCDPLCGNANGPVNVVGVEGNINLARAESAVCNPENTLCTLDYPCGRYDGVCGAHVVLVVENNGQGWVILSGTANPDTAQCDQACWQGGCLLGL